MFRIPLTLSVVVAASCCCSPCWADDSFQRDSLRGIKSLSVVAENVPEDVATQTGLSKQQIETDVELRLRRSGIMVQPKSDATLYVAVNAILLRDYSGRMISIVFSTQVEVDQTVTIDRPPLLIVTATTWERASLASSAPDRFLQQCRERAVPDLIDQFINAYLAVNSK
jgi:hypothetical protein